MTEEKDSICCSWYESCTYYMQCEHLYNENKDLSEDVYRLEQENKELKSDVLKWQKAFSRQYQINENKGYSKTEEKYRSALEEILESAKFAQCLPCGSGNLEDCLNCSDETTNNGQFCMEKRIYEIKTKCVEILND